MWDPVPGQDKPGLLLVTSPKEATHHRRAPEACLKETLSGPETLGSLRITKPFLDLRFEAKAPSLGIWRFVWPRSYSLCARGLIPYVPEVLFPMCPRSYLVMHPHSGWLDVASDLLVRFGFPFSSIPWDGLLWMRGSYGPYVTSSSTYAEALVPNTVEVRRKVFWR